MNTTHEYRGYVFTITYEAKEPAYVVDYPDIPTSSPAAIHLRRHLPTPARPSTYTWRVCKSLASPGPSRHTGWCCNRNLEPKSAGSPLSNRTQLAVWVVDSRRRLWSCMVAGDPDGFALLGLLRVDRCCRLGAIPIRSGQHPGCRLMVRGSRGNERGVLEADSQ